MNILPFLPDLLNAFLLTVVLLLSSIAIGLSLAIGMTMLRYTDLFFLKKPIETAILFICGTPLLVQLFLVYYGTSQIGWIRHSFLWLFFKDPMFCAIFTFAINTACYTSVLLWGAIHSVPHNEVDGAYALGMGKWLTFRRIIMPRALRLMLPAYSNEVMMVLKNTSLASTITLLELMGMTQQLVSQTYRTLEFYCLAGALYLFINLLIIQLFKRLAKHS